MVVVSNASCTTNCLAPLAKVINDKVAEDMSRLALRIGGDYTLASNTEAKPIVNEAILTRRTQCLHPNRPFQLRPLETYREYNM